MHVRLGGSESSTLPPVVLVHGQVVSSRYMEPLAERLAARTRVFVPDLPGFGKSAKPRETYDVPRLADALLGVLDACALDRPVLVGNSMGCQIAAELAAAHPERVSQLVLQGPTVDRHAQSGITQFVRWLRAGRFERPSLAWVLALDYVAAGARRTVQTYRALLNHRIERLLPRISVPTLVVRGNRDPIVPESWAQEVTSLLPEGSLVVIPGGGHTLSYSAPLELSRVVLAFMNGAPGAEQRR